jgi:hypothetical protein
MFQYQRGLWTALLLPPVLLIQGCVSPGRDFSPYAPLGIVAVVSNDDINWIGEETVPPTGLDKLVRGVFHREADGPEVYHSRADVLVTSAEAIIREVLTEAAFFDLAERERVLGAASYQEAGSAEGPRQVKRAAAQGYRFINYRDKKLPPALAEETGLRSFLYLSFDFTKAMTSGFGKSGRFQARVSMLAVLTDSRGKILYRRVFETSSPRSIPVSAGAYSHGELLELFAEAVTAAVERFVRDFAPRTYEGHSAGGPPYTKGRGALGPLGPEYPPLYRSLFIRVNTA